MFLNENWREILADIKPAMEEVLGIAYKEIGQQFLNRIPLNQIYIDWNWIYFLVIFIYYFFNLYYW